MFVQLNVPDDMKPFLEAYREEASYLSVRDMLEAEFGACLSALQKERETQTRLARDDDAIRTHYRASAAYAAGQALLRTLSDERTMMTLAVPADFERLKAHLDTREAPVPPDDFQRYLESVISSEYSAMRRLLEEDGGTCIFDDEWQDARQKAGLPPPPEIPF